MREVPSFTFQKNSVAEVHSALDRTFAFPLHPPELPIMSAAEPNRVGMHNTKGDFVDLYIPRKWYGPIPCSHPCSPISLYLCPRLSLPFLLFVFVKSSAPFCFMSYARYLNGSFSAPPLVV